MGVFNVKNFTSHGFDKHMYLCYNKRMTLLEAIFLGILQGLTEFLPISSSGHLVLAQTFLGLKEPLVFFDVMLHVGTLAAVLVVYREAIGKLAIGGVSTLADTQFWRKPGAGFNASTELKFIWLILLGSIPTGVIAVLFKDQLESFFDEVRLVSIMLILTGIILQLPRGNTQAKTLRRQDEGTSPLRAGNLKTWHAPLIGIAQGCAITPGISRSGTTISLALFFGDSSENGCGILLSALNPCDTRRSCAENPRCRRYYHTTTHRRRGDAGCVYCRLYRVAVAIGRAKPRQILSVFLLLHGFRVGIALNRLNPISRNASKDFLIVVAHLWRDPDTVQEVTNFLVVLERVSDPFFSSTFIDQTGEIHL